MAGNFRLESDFPVAACLRTICGGAQGVKRNGLFDARNQSVAVVSFGTYLIAVSQNTLPQTGH
jgi:hypothetical protein